MRFASLEKAIFGQLEVLTLKERVHAITLAPESDFRKDSELFGEGFRDGEAKRRTGLLLTRGLQTRSATELRKRDGIESGPCFGRI